jgi:hypothetical protein
MGYWQDQGLKDCNCTKCGAAIQRYRVLKGILCADCYTAQHKTTQAERDRRHREKDPDHRRAIVRASIAAWRSRDPEHAKAIGRAHSQSDKAKQTRSSYQADNAEIIKNKKREWHLRTWAERSPEITKKRRESGYSKDYHAKRSARDLNYKLRATIRSRFVGALKGQRNIARAESLIGCSLEFFRGYVEAKFTFGMSWENWGKKGWHLDHIKPLASFDMTDIGQQLEAFHYSNLQPLWWKDNLKKGAKIA